jgi:hypothetical protein
VLSGSARLLLCATGDATQLGRTAHALAEAPPPTAFERGARDFSLLLTRMTIALVPFVLLANALQQRPLLDAFMFAVALAVGLTPELLPMIVSVTLARGALRLAHQRVIVKRLSAIEDLGAMDVLATDKTGTLTEAHPSRAAPRRRRPQQRGGAGTGVPEQPLRDRLQEPPRRSDPGAPAARGAGLAQARRSAVRLRALACVGAGRARSAE